MAYFSKFPVLQYPVRDGDTFRFAFVANLLRRVGISNDLKGSDGAFIEYSVKDGERPEHIAERIYGDPSYHWLVLLVNDVIDPYHGWYKSSNAMEQYIQKKHGGYSVYIGTTSGGFFYNKDLQTGSSLSQGTAQASVEDYSPELCKLTVRGSYFEEGNAVLGISGTNHTVTIYRVDPSYTAVHHFEVDHVTGISGANSKTEVDPLSQQSSSFSVLGGIVGHTADEYPSSSQGITYSGSGAVAFSDTHIGKYMGVVGDKINLYSVSNYEYENNKNDSVRTIKVLHPRFKRQAVQELEALLRV